MHVLFFSIITSYLRVLIYLQALLVQPCILMLAVASLFQGFFKKENTVESKAKLIMDKCTAQEGSPSALEFISEELGAR